MVKELNRVWENMRRLLPLFLFILVLPHPVNGETAESLAAGGSREPSVPVKPKEIQTGLLVDSGSPQVAGYTCPMHPNEVSDKPGRCSQCGMFLVKSSNPVSAENRDAHSHEGHTDHQYDKMQMLASPAVGKGAKALSADGSRAAVENGMPLMPDQQSFRNAPPEPTNSPELLFWERQDSGLKHDQSIHQPTAMGLHRQARAHPARMRPETTEGTLTKASSLAAVETNSDTTYLCPMHPQIVQDHPGSCPICGMNLELHHHQSAGTEKSLQVYLPSRVIQNMGVRIARAGRQVLEKNIHTQGRVAPDEDGVVSIHARAGGWVENLYFVTEGDRVERKDELLDFYSPWINDIQLEYIKALEDYDMVAFDPAHKVEVEARVESLQNSLRLFNFMDMDIRKVRNSRKVQNLVQLTAPRSGIITQLDVTEGMYVEPYQSMFTIVDLKRVWVMADIYEHQAPWVRKGQLVAITTPAIPGRKWQGKIDFIYPDVDAKTRTLKARIIVSNLDEALLLNMFVQVDILNQSPTPVLTVPREAVIMTGERQSVIRYLGNGHFQPVDVETGLSGNGVIEILSGIEEGDQIVVSGQFLIDSESSLRASFLRLSK